MLIDNSNVNNVLNIPYWGLHDNEKFILSINIGGILISTLLIVVFK